jgi:hypothetical protein
LGRCQDESEQDLWHVRKSFFKRRENAQPTERVCEGRAGSAGDAVFATT